MAQGEIFDARFKNKRDTQENWEKSDCVLLDGELIVVDMDDGSINFKVGDGTSSYNDLSFVVTHTVSDGEGGVVGTVSGSEAVDCTLLATEWAEGEQTLTVAGLGATQNGVVSISPTYTAEEYEALSLAEVAILEQTSGSLKVGASGTIPEIDIPLVVILLS